MNWARAWLVVRLIVPWDEVAYRSELRNIRHRGLIIRKKLYGTEQCRGVFKLIKYEHIRFELTSIGAEVCLH